MMTRRSTLLLPLILGGCAPAPPLEEMLPKACGEAWTLGSAAPLPEDSAPDLARGLGLRRAVRGSYRGRGEVAVTIFEMSSQASAFELLQKWRAGASSAYFHRDRYFVVVESADLDRASLDSFTKDLERRAF